jgi:glucose-1-phosphate cytidylyltransferase
VKVVILCGGRGTRIRDVADDIPKPLIPVGRYPILWHIMKYYATWGHKDFILCLGYRGQLIKDFFLNYAAQTRDFSIVLGGGIVEYHSDFHEADWKVTLVDTGLDAQTGARVRKIRRYVEGEPNFMLTYGDGLGNIDLDHLKTFHESHRRILTVSGVRPPGRFGEIVAKDGRIVEFNEKPQATGGLISGGYFVCSPGLFSYLEGGEDLVLEESPMRRLVQDGEMMVYQHDGFWQPMDTFRDYKLLNALHDKGDAPWVRWA